jgi:hypothetical protein
MMVYCLIPALFQANSDDRETLGRSKTCDILEWEQGCQPLRADLFFSLRVISFLYTDLYMMWERQRLKSKPGSKFICQVSKFICSRLKKGESRGKTCHAKTIAKEVIFFYFFFTNF